jgi:hypothetical protein
LDQIKIEPHFFFHTSGQILGFLGNASSIFFQTARTNDTLSDLLNLKKKIKGPCASLFLIGSSTRSGLLGSTVPDIISFFILIVFYMYFLKNIFKDYVLIDTPSL